MRHSHPVPALKCYTHTHTHTHIYIYVCVCVCVCVCIATSVCVCVCVYVRIHIYIYIYILVAGCWNTKSLHQKFGDRSLRPVPRFIQARTAYGTARISTVTSTKQIFDTCNKRHWVFVTQLQRETTKYILCLEAMTALEPASRGSRQRTFRSPTPSLSSRFWYQNIDAV